VYRDGAEIALLPTEHRVLEVMLRHARQTITRMTLFDAVGVSHLVPRTDPIDCHIGRLRKKILAAEPTPDHTSCRRPGHDLSSPVLYVRRFST
ncbi:winged helix-turn-helix domain-containing protein, partial [Burkholderia thailandensis]|uniref:winged helix-turn-helix domain-containing protein n=1 Tax=Burkholderia thailandensis TaxID=57975 RepID=UPI00217CCE9B